MYFSHHQYEKTKKENKNVVLSDKQHAKTNSDIICFITKDCSLIFIYCNVVNYNVSSTSLVKLVVDGIAAQKIDNLLAIKQSVLVLN